MPRTLKGMEQERNINLKFMNYTDTFYSIVFLTLWLLNVVISLSFSKEPSCFSRQGLKGCLP